MSLDILYWTSVRLLPNRVHGNVLCKHTGLIVSAKLLFSVNYRPILLVRQRLVGFQAKVQLLDCLLYDGFQQKR